jgi:hypothetical protein
VPRQVWSDITATAHHFEQAFSDDGGKTWETNFKELSGTHWEPALKPLPYAAACAINSSILSIRAKPHTQTPAMSTRCFDAQRDSIARLHRSIRTTHKG